VAVNTGWGHVSPSPGNGIATTVTTLATSADIRQSYMNAVGWQAVNTAWHGIDT